jgi:hypothetical protein
MGMALASGAYLPLPLRHLCASLQAPRAAGTLRGLREVALMYVPSRTVRQVLTTRHALALDGLGYQVVEGACSSREASAIPQNN